AGRMEAAVLVAVVSGSPDTDHHLGAGDEGADQITAAAPTLLRDGEARHQRGCARMHAAVRPRQIVHLEGMGERALGQRRRRRVYRDAARTENAAPAAGSVPGGEGSYHSAPGQVIAENDGGDGVGDTLLGALDHVGRNVLVTTAGRVFGHLRGLVR